LYLFIELIKIKSSVKSLEIFLTKYIALLINPNFIWIFLSYKPIYWYYNNLLL